MYKRSLAVPILESKFENNAFDFVKWQFLSGVFQRDSPTPTFWISAGSFGNHCSVAAGQSPTACGAAVGGQFFPLKISAPERATRVQRLRLPENRSGRESSWAVRSLTSTGQRRRLCATATPDQSAHRTEPFASGDVVLCLRLRPLPAPTVVSQWHSAVGTTVTTRFNRHFVDLSKVFPRRDSPITDRIYCFFLAPIRHVVE